MLAASSVPSAPPAPTSVCSSSMKATTLALRSSSITWRRRSSNSPRYFVPATMLLRSIDSTRTLDKLGGTRPSTMACASPSTMAVLPTPGSPMSTGLFFVRRDRIWMTRRISSVRPMTGSSLPSRASRVRSRAYSSRNGVLTVSTWFLGSAAARMRQRTVSTSRVRFCRMR